MLQALSLLLLTLSLAGFGFFFSRGQGEISRNLILSAFAAIGLTVLWQSSLSSLISPLTAPAGLQTAVAILDGIGLGAINLVTFAIFICGFALLLGTNTDLAWLLENEPDNLPALIRQVARTLAMPFAFYCGLVLSLMMTFSQYLGVTVVLADLSVVFFAVLYRLDGYRLTTAVPSPL